MDMLTNLPTLFPEFASLSTKRVDPDDPSGRSTIPPIQNEVTSARIAIIDDEPLNIEVVKTYLQRAGFKDLKWTSNSIDALPLIQSFQPDVLLLDLVMPEVSGLEILAALRKEKAFAHLPVIVLTACSESETKLQTIKLGIADFLAKPVDDTELILRIRNVLLAKRYQDQLERYSDQLQRDVEVRTEELKASRQQLVRCLAMAAEFRDDDTGHHVSRVGKYSAIIAEQLGFQGNDVELIYEAAQLHDVGKIGVPDSILLKEGKLNQLEFERIKNHCCMGKDILRPLSNEQVRKYRDHTVLGERLLRESSFPVMKLAAVIAQTHHEKFDGSGYPLGLQGEDIPIEGRIVAVADVFDALSSKRPYKPAFSREKCFRILQEGRGSHFDPRVLDAFFQRTAEIIQTQIEFADVEQVESGTQA
ncbi:MAG: response regulator [Mariniblastus sp.]|nr:response regulator [Mariniblastus sp.]